MIDRMSGPKWEDANLHLFRVMAAETLREMRRQGMPAYLVRLLDQTFRDHQKDGGPRCPACPASSSENSSASSSSTTGHPKEPS